MSTQPPHAGEELNLDAEPAVPRPAATIILLRRGGKHSDRGVEVCLVKRNPNARFMPGVWVFPGGGVKDAEGDDDLAFRSCAIRELEEEAGITLDSPDELVAFSRWITPEEISIRFDTYFYVALAPAHAPPKPDGGETVDAGWFGPARALELHREGEMGLVFPTIKHLEALLPFATADEVLEAARERRVTAVQPRLIVDENGQASVVLPGEPGYDDAKLL